MGTASVISNSAHNSLTTIRSEDVFRSTHSLGEALRILLPRVKAGDFDAFRALTLVAGTCKAMRERGVTTFDEFLRDKRALDNPKRRALLTKRQLYCRSDGGQLSEAQQILDNEVAYETEAIKRGDPEAVVASHMTGSIKRIDPMHATQESLHDAFTRVAKEGSPSAKMRLSIGQLSFFADTDVKAINQEAQRQGETNLMQLQVAAATLYGCHVGRYCGPRSEIQESACFIDGKCDDMPVETYIREHQFSPIQIAFVDRYLSVLEMGSRLPESN